MILGIDYGRAHLGLAISEGSLAEPLATLEITNYKLQITKIREIVTKYAIKNIVLGVSEGKMLEETKAWGKNLANMLELPVEFVDETLSSVEAGEGQGPAGRQAGNHAKSAAIILQRYLDDKVKS